MPLTDVTTPGSDGRLLVEATAANPEEDTPKLMLIDYLGGFDDPRGEMLRGCMTLRGGGAKPQLRYVHGYYAAPEVIRYRGSAVSNSHAAQRILTIAMTRKLYAALFTDKNRRLSRGSATWMKIDTAPANVPHDWLSRFFCAAELYACHLTTPVDRDAAMSGRDGDRHLSAVDMIRRNDNWWYRPPTPGAPPAVGAHLTWLIHSQVSRVRALLLACRSGKRTACAAYESATSVSRDYGFGHEETHDAYRALVEAWTELMLWKYETQIYTLRRQEKWPSLYGGKAEDDASPF